MAVRIRLTRVGATKQPTYRVVVADSRKARDSRSIETLGHYNPRKDPVEFEVDAEKAKAWMAKGALPSDTVARLFRNVGVLPADSAPKYPVKPAKPVATAKAEAAPKAAKPEPAASAAPAEAAEAAEADEAPEAAVSAEPEATTETAEPEASADTTESTDEEAAK